jgi:hypothetical protein
MSTHSRVPVQVAEAKLAGIDGKLNFPFISSASTASQKVHSALVTREQSPHRLCGRRDAGYGRQPCPEASQRRCANTDTASARVILVGRVVHFFVRRHCLPMSK